MGQSCIPLASIRAWLKSNLFLGATEVHSCSAFAFSKWQLLGASFDLIGGEMSMPRTSASVYFLAKSIVQAPEQKQNDRKPGNNDFVESFKEKSNFSSGYGVAYPTNLFNINSASCPFAIA